MDGLGAACGCGAPIEGLAVDGPAGGVMLRSIGAAGAGAVRVAGGAEKVREPRLPMLPPPPALASATAGASAKTAARRTDFNAPSLKAQ